MVPGSEGQAGSLRPLQDQGNGLIGDLENEGRLNGCSAPLCSAGRPRARRTAL